MEWIPFQLTALHAYPQARGTYPPRAPSTGYYEIRRVRTSQAPGYESYFVTLHGITHNPSIPLPIPAYLIHPTPSLHKLRHPYICIKDDPPSMYRIMHAIGLPARTPKCERLGRHSRDYVRWVDNGYACLIV
jgi:hypothetical protein